MLLPVEAPATDRGAFASASRLRRVEDDGWQAVVTFDTPAAYVLVSDSRSASNAGKPEVLVEHEEVHTRIAMCNCGLATIKAS